MTMGKQLPNYGIDGPGIVWAMILGGIAALAGGLLMARWDLSPAAGHVAGGTHTVLVFGIVCLAIGSLMFVSSRFGKLHVRDRLIAHLRLRGDETVLDVGCGHGLLLIGAAKQLPHGRAVGIDLWSQRDQAGNSREATLRNASLEGVAQRVSVHDGDMRKLPFADGMFDAAVAHFAIHNILSPRGRREAIREIVRTLKPGGQVAISDCFSVDLYAAELWNAGMSDIDVSGFNFLTFPPARMVTARKPPDTEFDEPALDLLIAAAIVG